MDNKLNDIKMFLRNEQITYDKNEHISDIAEKIKDTKGKALDEIGLLYGEEELKTTLDVYLSEFYDLLIEDVCNVIDSFSK